VSSSLWLEDEHEPLPRVRISGRADVAVVGGGVTGCACALALAQGGARVRLFEARRVAEGASGRNGGFALRGSAAPYDRVRHVVGSERARELWGLTERALDRIEELAGDALVRSGSLRLALDAAERQELEAEYAALREDGFAADWRDELDPPLQSHFQGVLVHPTDGALQPARWVRRLARLAAEAGADIREGTRVESLGKLDADEIVIATDGYTSGLHPALDAAIRPARGQVLVTEPLPEQLFPRPHYARYGYEYWHQLRDGRLVIGGCRDASLETEATAEEATTELVQGRLEAVVRGLLGRVPRVTHRWSGIFGVTVDDLPLAGRVPGRDRVWVAAGYSGHGNVLGFVCGGLVAAALLGRPAPALALLDPSRTLEPEDGHVL